jgi:hypothetical protein
MSPVLKDLSSGPPKPAESVPERMDGEFVGIDTITTKLIRAFHVGMNTLSSKMV